MARLMIQGELVTEFKTHNALCGVRGDSVVLSREDITELFTCSESLRLAFFEKLMHRIVTQGLENTTMKTIRERNRELEALLLETTEAVTKCY